MLFFIFSLPFVLLRLHPSLSGLLVALECFHSISWLAISVALQSEGRTVAYLFIAWLGALLAHMVINTIIAKSHGKRTMAN